MLTNWDIGYGNTVNVGLKTEATNSVVSVSPNMSVIIVWSEALIIRLIITY